MTTSDDAPYTLDIPAFLRRKTEPYHDKPISEWPIIPAPVKYAGFNPSYTTPSAQPAPPSSSHPSRIADNSSAIPTVPQSPPAIKRRPLRGAVRDQFALAIATAIKNGADTFQALRKAFPQHDGRTIRSALRRALAMHLVELDGRRYRRV